MNENMEDITKIIAEREWEEFKKSSFGKFFTAKQMRNQELTYLNNKFRHDFFKITKDVVIKLKGFDIIMPNHMKPIDWVIEVMEDKLYILMRI